MGIFDRFFKKKKPAPAPPIDLQVGQTVDLIEGKLSVAIFSHIQQTKHGKMNCISYATKGLSSVGQKEMVFTMNAENTEGKPIKLPIDFFHQIYGLAQTGRIVDHGQFTEFGERGFLQWKGIVYAPVYHKIQNLDLTDYLSVICLSKAEIQALTQIGSTRILSMLGKQQRFYPYPFWNDVARPELDVDSMMEPSVLTKVSRAFLFNSSVTIVDNHVKLYLQKDHIEDFVKDIQTSPNPIGILPAFNQDTSGYLTWSDEPGKPDAIIPPGGGPHFLGGCFLIVSGGQEENSARIMEDGFGVMMNEQTWEAFGKALAEKGAFSFPASTEGKGFEIEWRG